ncbi:MAG: citrate transporter [Lachnospiraceae bacterium]|nr:citrate transporter [Lachnospiraceae bacterium]
MEQVISVAIFVIMFAIIISEKIERHYVSLGAGFLMLVVVLGICMHSPSAIWDTINLKEFATKAFWIAKEEGAGNSAGINWATIVFIFGMMVMVEGMGRAGFFRWLCLRMAKAVKYQTLPIFLTFMVTSFLLAMFIDSITVILFPAAVTVELAEVLSFSPVPMILAEIFCANLGGSATMCGDPPNIIIGTSLGYTFGEFLENTGLIAGISLVFVIAYFYFCFRKELTKKQSDTVRSYPEPASAIHSKKEFAISCVIFGCAVVLLVTHSMTGLTVATIGTFIAALTLLTSFKAAPILLKKVDYKTLLFFVGLFIVVGGLEQTGVLNVIAGFISNVCGDNAYVMVAVILWVSAIASAFVDNIPFAATMIPVIQSLAASTGMDLSVLSWTLACGTDVGGSATPIGASANVVGVSIAAQNGHMIGWGRYCKVMAPITVITMAISMLCIYFRYLSV